MLEWMSLEYQEKKKRTEELDGAGTDFTRK